MSTTSKIYTISIQMDAARQSLDDATKKLTKLDAQLEGLDRDGAAAKAIVADMGKAAAEVEKLTASVGGLENKLDALVPLGPGTVGALRQEVVQLEAAFEQGVVGSAELGATITQLADKKSQLRELANTVNALNPRAQARAFTVFGGAVVGAFSTATVAAQVFGLSSEKAQEYQAKLQGLITVLYSVEAVNKALNGENVALIKSVVASGKAWLTAGEAASTGSKVTRGALISSGIGILLVLVATLIGVVVENWDKLTGSVKGSVQFLSQFKAVASGLFDGLLEGLKLFFEASYKLFTFDFSGLVDTFDKGGRRVADAYAKGYQASLVESNRKTVDLQLAAADRLIAILKAKGKETEDLEIAQAIKRANNLKQSTEEEKKAYQDALKEIAVLKATAQKKFNDEEKALESARLVGLAAIEQSAGKESYRQLLASELQKLAVLKSAGIQNKTAIEQQQFAITTLTLAHAKELTEKQQAQLLAQLEAQIALRKAKGLESYNQELAQERATLKILQSAGIRNEAEITAQLGRIAALRAARAKEQQDKANAAAVSRLQADIALENAIGADSYEAQVRLEEKKLALLKAAGIKNAAAIIDQQSKLDALAAAHALKEENDTRALEQAKTQVQISLAQARGEQTIELELQLKRQELTGLLAALDQNAAAIAAKEGEIAVLKIQQEQKAMDRRRALLEEQQGYELALLQKQGKDTLAIEIENAKALIALDTDTSEKGLKQKRADIAALNLLLEEQKSRLPDLGGALLRALGVKPEDLQLVKQAITQAVSEVYGSLQQLAGAFIDGALQAADQQLQAIQNRAQLIDQQLQDSKSGADKALAEVEKSTGARRDFYLQQLEKERAKTEQLQAAKRKAAAEEKKQTEEKHRLEKLGQEIAAASALATNVAAAAAAVYAGIKAVSAGSEIPFPGNLVAIAAGIAAVVAAVASAKQLSTATKYANGGIIEGGSHASGNDVPILGGKYRVEGGEGILPVDATQKNRAAFELLRTTGRTRVITPADFARIANVQVLPPPSGTFGNGGVVPGAGSLPAGSMLIASTDLSALLDTNRQMLARLDAVAASNEQIKSYGPAQLHIGPTEYVKLGELGQQVTDTKSAVSLG